MAYESEREEFDEATMSETKCIQCGVKVTDDNARIANED